MKRKSITPAYDKAMRSVRHFEVASIDRMNMEQVQHVLRTIGTLQANLTDIRLRADRGATAILAQMRETRNERS